MKKLLVVFFLFSMGITKAQQIIQKDPAIEKMVSEINSDSLHRYITTLVGFHTRHTLSTITSRDSGIGAAREWVVSKFRDFAKQSNGRMTAMLDKWTLEPDGKRMDTRMLMGNPMAILKGTDTSDNRVFMICGHLDSRVTDVQNRTSFAPGANDDGSGVAALIECARVMSRYPFSATIVFAALSGEEQGLYGGQRMADYVKQNNWNLQGMLNNDIIGSNNSNQTNIIDNTRIRVFSEGLPAYETEKNAVRIRAAGLENDGACRQLARYIKETGERYVANIEVVMIYRNDRFLRGGDHLPLVQQGYPAVRITEMNENFDHQHQDIKTKDNTRYGDLPEFMDFEYLRKNAGVNLASLANLAKSPSVPKHVTIDVKELSNFTQLNWEKSASGKPKGYYVLIRETSAPCWQKKIFTSELSMRLPYSKDNYFFAVQSVNNEGNESIMIIPDVK